MKTKTSFVCQECGYESARWLGRCPDCGKWNTLQEEVQAEESPHETLPFSKNPAQVTSLREVKEEDVKRLNTGLGELDRLMGGGIVPGSFTLIGGEPGIGKSTLLLQMCHSLAEKGSKVLYVSGEESVSQTKLRSSRLKADAPGLFVLSENNADVIAQHIQQQKPHCVIIDSIQSLYRPEVPAAPGSVSQVRECSHLFFSLCKNLGIPVFLVGHVTKDGSLAGPRVLEHLVDTVLYFEGDRFLNLRVLRAVKNRFGSTNEIGLFEMQEQGLVEVKDPSRLLLSERPSRSSGSVVVPAMEGSRPFLIEIQALVSPANFPVAQRVTTGVDYNRFCILLAVLEKKAGLPLQGNDIFANVAGGFRTTEPATDLGLALAIASSALDCPVPEEVVVFGEIGLAGEVRGVQHAEKRVMEAAKQGFKKCYLSQHQLKSLGKKAPLEVIGVADLREAIDQLLRRKDLKKVLS